MSRSRKKNPIVKDRGRSKKKDKKLANKRIRANTRNVFSNLAPIEDKLFTTHKARNLTNPYDICDSIWKLDINYVWYYWDYKGDKHCVKNTAKDIRLYYNK